MFRGLEFFTKTGLGVSISFFTLPSQDLDLFFEAAKSLDFLEGYKMNLKVLMHVFK